LLLCRPSPKETDMLLPATTRRVTDHTDAYVNEMIRLRTEMKIVEALAAGPYGIEKRLAELDREWDIERALEANAASISLAGFALGAFVNRAFFVLPAVVAGFLLQHALQGWCPPVPVMRRLGMRTQTEIEQERYALKLLRGDFKEVASPDKNIVPDQTDILRAVRK
jgi:hypothetical protein